MMLAEHDAWDQVKPKRGYRSNAELEMREAVERWGRIKWPEARVVHELVMDRGKARADMAFISPDNLVSIELKSQFDTTERLMLQAAMFRLATPEFWVVVDERHAKDADLVHYLLPSIGVATAWRRGASGAHAEYQGGFDVAEVRQPASWHPHPEALLNLLWVAELASEANRARVWQGKPGTHAKLVQAMLRLELAEQVAAVCRQLRARDAFWRADAPIYETADATSRAKAGRG